MRIFPIAFRHYDSDGVTRHACVIAFNLSQRFGSWLMIA